MLNARLDTIARITRIVVSGTTTEPMAKLAALTRSHWGEMLNERMGPSSNIWPILDKILKPGDCGGRKCSDNGKFARACEAKQLSLVVAPAIRRPGSIKLKYGSPLTIRGDD